MLALYVDPISVNSRKVLAAAQHLDITHEVIPVRLLRGEHQRDEFATLNPNRMVPVLRDGALVISESNAIVLHLLGRSPHDGFDAARAAHRLQWMFWESSQWSSACYRFTLEHLIKPLTGGGLPAITADDEARFHRFAAVLDGQLRRQRWLLGEEGPDVADLVAAAPMHLHEVQRLPLAPYPAIRRWIGDVEDLPAWKATQPELNPSAGAA